MIDPRETEKTVRTLPQQRAKLEPLEAALLDLAAELDTNILFRTLLSHAIDLTDGSAGRLFLRQGNRSILQPVASVGTESAPLEGPAATDLGVAERVMESGSPQVVECSIQRDGSTVPAALAAVPIQKDDQFEGVLQVQAPATAGFSPDALDRLNRLACGAAVAIQNARRYQAATLRADHLAIVNRVSHAVSKTLDLQGLTNVVYREIEAAFDVDAFFMAIYDEETDELDYRLQVDDGETIPRERRPLGQGLTAAVVREKEPLLIRDFEEEQDDLPPAEPWGSMRTPASWLGVPMHVGDRILGVICVQAYHPQAYGEMEQQLLTTISEQVSIGVENSRLYQETSRRLAQSQVLRELMVTAASTLDFDLVLERTLEALHNTMQVEPVGFAMPDPRGDYLQLHPSKIGFPADAEDRGLDLEGSVCGRVFRTGEPVVIDDVRDTPYHDRCLPETRSEIVVPVGVHGQVAGVLDVASSRPNDFGEDDLGFYTTIASQLGVALENARLFESERRQRLQTEALEKAAAVISGTLDLDQVLDRILQQVERVVEGDAFNVVLIEEDGRADVVRRRGYDTEDWGVESLSVDDYPLLQRMIENREPIVVPDTRTDPRWVQETGQEAWQSYVGAPIKVGEVVVGFLNVNSTRLDAFSEDEAQRLQAFAHHAAAALENAQLYKELHSHADALEKRVEERTAQLRSQYAQLEAILDSTMDGIVLAGSDGELILANPVARKWLRQALSPNESDQLQEAVRALAAKAEARPEVVLELTGLDLQLTAAPVHKPAMEDARAVVAIHDVTHIKALNRMKSHFVSNVSHELRTPIATIKLLAHLMKQQPDKWGDYVDPLIREAEHQAKLVRDILEMSRVDAGRLEIHPEPTSLNDLTAMAIEKYDTQIQDCNLTVIYEPAEPDPTAWADSKWMMQVLNNLLSNAVRYTPEGGTIEVATGSESAQGRSWATITVSDNGIGIPEDELPYIFDRFYRGEEPRTMQISGTGLGLAILKEIVELHGGRVTVDSEVGEGSSFTVWLPCESQA